MIFTFTIALAHRAGISIATPAASAALALALAFSVPAAAHPPKNEDQPKAAKAGHDEKSGHHEAGEAAEGHGEKAGHEHGDETFTFGRPAPDAKPDRRVRITALDTMRFNPPAIDVEAGGVIEFVVTNNGRIAHSWALGTPEEQQEHEQGMGNMPMMEMMTHMDGEPNGFVLKPGETKTLVWRFSESREIQYACHIPGHFSAGMVGTITVKDGDAGMSGDPHGN